MCIKRPAGLSAGPGARGEDEESVRERERAALSAGEMEFYLDESSDRSARMGSGVTAGRINDKKQPDRINGGRQGGVFPLCSPSGS